MHLIIKYGRFDSVFVEDNMGLTLRIPKMKRKIVLLTFYEKVALPEGGAGSPPLK